jgi:hypothetical protein
MMNKCSVCDCAFTDDEGGIHGYFGMLSVSFCPSCFSCMCDMVNQVTQEFGEEE